jgi:hypothetical protein
MAMASSICHVRPYDVVAELAELVARHARHQVVLRLELQTAVKQGLTLVHFSAQRKRLL